MQLSVILPAYNVEDYIAEAMDSILTQTYTDYELIIVDDGSTDRTPEIVRDNATDKKVKVITNATNQGLTKSLNIGIAEAKGKYIARQDGDDISLPTRLAEQVAFMEANPEIALLGTDMQVLNEDKLHVKKPKNPNPTFEDLLAHNSVVGASVMIRKSALDEVGVYDEAFRVTEDYELTLRVAKRFNVATLSKPLYVQRIRYASISIAGADDTALWAMLARGIHSGQVDRSVLAHVHKEGITAYYKMMPSVNKIWYHKRRAATSKRYKLRQAAIHHYDKLQDLQGWNWKVAVKRWLVMWKVV